MLRRTARLRLAALALAAPLALAACSGGDGVEGTPADGIVPSEGAGGNEMEDDSGSD